MGKKSIGKEYDLSEVGIELNEDQESILNKMKENRERAYKNELKKALQNGLSVEDGNGNTTAEKIIAGCIGGLLERGASTNDVLNLMKATGENTEDKVTVNVNLSEELKKISSDSEF